jgi:hypothetical protein
MWVECPCYENVNLTFEVISGYFFHIYLFIITFQRSVIGSKTNGCRISDHIMVQIQIQIINMNVELVHNENIIQDLPSN